MGRGVVKPGPGLNAFLDSSKSVEKLFGDVQKYVLAKATQPNGRREDVLHPSEMVKRDWCYRAALQRLRHGRVQASTTFTRENIFQEGHSTHAKWQKWFQEMHRLAGDWYCRGCRQVFWSDDTPDACELCEHADLDYAEVPLNAEALTIGGKSDGYCPDDGCLLEIKTLGLGSLRYEDPKWLSKYDVYTPGRGHSWDLDRLWRDFQRPLPTAFRQGQLYLYLARHFEDLEVDRILFIYDFKPTQAVKAFMVPYDESISEPLIHAAEAITACLDAGTDMPCNIAGPAGCASCRPYETDPV